jgi:hypothetical protein
MEQVIIHFYAYRAHGFVFLLVFTAAKIVKFWISGFQNFKIGSYPFAVGSF